jgi:hypothetical protein
VRQVRAEGLAAGQPQSPPTRRVRAGDPTSVQPAAGGRCGADGQGRRPEARPDATCCARPEWESQGCGLLRTARAASCPSRSRSHAEPAGELSSFVIQKQLHHSPRNPRAFHIQAPKRFGVRTRRAVGQQPTPHVRPATGGAHSGPIDCSPGPRRRRIPLASVNRTHVATEAQRHRLAQICSEPPVGWRSGGAATCR